MTEIAKYFKPLIYKEKTLSTYVWGLHSDDERELGKHPIIASLSLGEERIFILKHKTRKDLKPKKLPLASGSLLLMKGETQRYWKHGIEKERHPCGPRVNLTFRRIHL